MAELVLCLSRSFRFNHFWFSKLPDMSAFVFATCELLVAHFRNLVMPEALGHGFHSRVFSHLLHPEERFVFAGRSQLSTTGVETRFEHLVPGRVLYQESTRLICEGELSDAEIAR